jgi:cell division protein FtsZ
MSEQGKAMMGTAKAAGVDRARIAAEQAVASPLLEGIDLSGARGVLVNITASRSLKLKETKEVMNTIRAFAAEDATVIFGTVYDDAMGDDLRVTVVATGLGRAKQKPQLVPQTTVNTVLRTGTDNIPMMGQPVQQGASGASGALGAALAAGVSSPAAMPTAPAVDYHSYDTPAVFRSSRESATARVSALEESGMDRYDIPAFLRRQAD